MLGIWKIFKSFLQIAGVILTIFALFLIIETKYSIVDEAWLASIIVPYISDRYNKKFHELLGEPLDMFQRSATEEARFIADRLKLRVVYHDMHKIDYSKSFVMVVNEHSIFDGCFVADGVDMARHSVGSKLLRIKQYYLDSRDTYSMPLVHYHKSGKNKLELGASNKIAEHLSSNPLIICASGKYDTRLFDKSPYFHFKSGFLRFANNAKVGIVPAHVDLKLPFWLKLMNSLWPVLTEDVIHYLSLDLLYGKTLTITFGDLIPFEEVAKDGLKSSSGYPRSLLKRYEDAVFALKGN